MDIAVILDVIGTVGFPIFVALALGLFIWRIYRKSEEREEALRQEIKESREINGKFAEIIAAHTAELGEIKTDIRDIKHVLEIPSQDEE